MTHEHAQHDVEAKQVILDNIDKYGCHICLLEPDNYLPGFAYSIGLYKKFNHPEIICFGLKTDLMGHILNHACSLIKAGEILVPGKLYKDFLEGYDIQFVAVDKEYYPDYLGYGCWFYDMTVDFPAIQLIWPDKEAKFPWEPSFNTAWKFKQPMLDRSIDFKFYEERNTGVYTTKEVFEGEPILYVYHNDDGDWQFHSSAEPKLQNAKLVCLEEITKLDPTINSLYDLQFGWKAWRESVEDEWQYEEDTRDEAESALNE